MRNKELNTGLGVEDSCKLCGKLLPARNNNAGLACRTEGLCRECYDNAYLVCKECGNDLPKGKDLKYLAARIMGYCLYCYGAKFPDRKANAGLVIEGDGPDYENNDSPYGWLDQFHEDMR